MHVNKPRHIAVARYAGVLFQALGGAMTEGQRVRAAVLCRTFAVAGQARCRVIAG